MALRFVLLSLVFASCKTAHPDKASGPAQAGKPAARVAAPSVPAASRDVDLHPFEALAEEAQAAARDFLADVEGTPAQDAGMKQVRESAAKLAEQDREAVAAAFASSMPDEAEQASIDELPPALTSAAGSAAISTGAGSGAVTGGGGSGSSTAVRVVKGLAGFTLAVIGAAATYCMARYWGDYDFRARAIGGFAAAIGIGVGGWLVYSAAMGLTESPEERFLGRMDRIARVRQRLLPGLRAGTIPPLPERGLALACPGRRAVATRAKMRVSPGVPSVKTWNGSRGGLSEQQAGLISQAKSGDLGYGVWQANSGSLGIATTSARSQSTPWVITKGSRAHRQLDDTLEIFDSSTPGQTHFIRVPVPATMKVTKPLTMSDVTSVAVKDGNVRFTYKTGLVQEFSDATGTGTPRWKAVMD